GRDFASAVELHIAASQELLQFLARSRSARLEVDRSPANRADEQWGPNFWYQRMMVTAFGGDPLAVAQGGPWIHPTQFSRPGASFFSDFGNWPPPREMPFSSVETDDPRVSELMGLARHFDRLMLSLKANVVNSSGQCDALDPTKSAQELYK